MFPEGRPQQVMHEADFVGLNYFVFSTLYLITWVSSIEYLSGVYLTYNN